MLPLSEFATLPLDEQAEYLWEKGTCEVSQVMDRYSVSLFRLGDCSAELWYDLQMNTIHSVAFFNSSGKMNRRNVSLAGLFR